MAGTHRGGGHTGSFFSTQTRGVSVYTEQEMVRVRSSLFSFMGWG